MLHSFVLRKQEVIPFQVFEICTIQVIMFQVGFEFVIMVKFYFGLPTMSSFLFELLFECDWTNSLLIYYDIVMEAIIYIVTLGIVDSSTLVCELGCPHANLSTLHKILRIYYHNNLYFE